MGFKSGREKTGGRPAGGRNKRTEEFYFAMEKAKFNVPQAYLWAYKQAKRDYMEYGDRFDQNRISPMEDNRPKLLSIMVGILKDIASYIYPKVKAIEIVNVNLLEGMTPEQRLEAMKTAVTKLELDIQNGSRTL